MVESTDRDLVLFTAEGGVGTITLNRPAKRNALSYALLDQLDEVLRGPSRDCSAIVVAANGPVFCAGVDLKEQQRIREAGQADHHAHGSHRWANTLGVIARHPAVFVAAVGGLAVGGGLTLVNLCGLAVASRSASFGMPEMGFGVFPAQAGPSTMRRILPKHAAAMVFLPDAIPAAEAYRIGLVNRVVEDEQLLPTADAIARRIAELSPVALDHAKKGLADVELMPLLEGISYGNYVNAMIREGRASADARSGSGR